MGCGGSKNKDDVQTAPPPKKTSKGQKDGGKEQGGRSPAKKAPPSHSKADNSKADHDGEGDNKKLKKKKDQLRQELVLAAESRDMERLEKAIGDYDRHKLPNCAELSKARRVLLALHEQALHKAMEEEKLEGLEAALEAAQGSEVSRELHEGHVLAEAEELRSLLRRLRLYLHKVLELKPMTVSEIHSYHRPRPLVHAVMKATYLLLGEHELQLQKWDHIQSLLRRQGRGGIIRRIKEFEPRQMKKAKVHRAEDHLKHCHHDKVRQTSAGASTFFNWSYNIINEGKSESKKEKKKK